MERSIPDLLNEIREKLDVIEAHLPSRVDAMVSPESKLPFKALVYRAASMWRMAELSRGAYNHFNEGRLANAILLTRAALETSGGLWYLAGKLKAAVTGGAVGDLDEYLMRLGVGSRTDANMPQAISVLTFVDRVEKDVEGFRHQYDVLSEFSHPNWAGTGLLYSTPDPANFWTDFGLDMGRTEGSKTIGVVSLSVALMFYERSYNTISDDMPAFIDLCRRHNDDPCDSDPL